MSRELIETVKGMNKVGLITDNDFFDIIRRLVVDDDIKISENSNGRVSPQLSCTILPEDKKLLNEITVFAVKRTGKAVSTSSVIRALIRLGNNRKDELDF